MVCDAASRVYTSEAPGGGLTVLAGCVTGNIFKQKTTQNAVRTGEVSNNPMGELRGNDTPKKMLFRLKK